MKVVEASDSPLRERDSGRDYRCELSPVKGNLSLGILSLVVGQFQFCSGGLSPPVLNSQGVPALGERRYSKLTHYSFFKSDLNRSNSGRVDTKYGGWLIVGANPLPLQGEGGPLPATVMAKVF
jgi:hypothetical protein